MNTEKNTNGLSIIKFLLGLTFTGLFLHIIVFLIGAEPSGPSQDGSSSPSQSQSSTRKAGKLEEEIRSRINIPDVLLSDLVNIDVSADADTLMSTFEDLKRQYQEILAAVSGKSKEGAEDSVTELQEQINRLKAHLGRKRDEANLLKDALHSTQHTAEKAMSSLKMKYESEKESSTRTLAQLRKELNQRKE